MLITVKDVAKLLGVSEKSVYRWMNERELPAHRIGGQFRFNRAELIAWTTARKINVAPQVFDEPEGEAPLPSLAEALEAGGVFYRMTGVDKESVLANVVDYLRLPEGTDRALLFQLILAREKLASTGVGDGIAIPHPRSPIVLHAEKPVVTLCFLEEPVEFGALDGKPVQTLFVVVSPTLRGHLHLMARVSFAVRDPEFKALLLEQASRDSLIGALRRMKPGPPSEPAVPVPGE
jgi:PTS system nitrogen regulatory IIA component